jgi:hypothetical protein
MEAMNNKSLGQREILHFLWFPQGADLEVLFLERSFVFLGKSLELTVREMNIFVDIPEFRHEIPREQTKENTIQLRMKLNTQEFDWCCFSPE